ncbi:MAG: GNAT family N-acetyltransferase, partial [Caldilineaceae bacterium]|nr:GNAT family N-acetyltransferase [Caldilineaceae bacterium]
SPNQFSLAQAYVERWWQPYAILADDTMVGFVLYGCWPASGVSVYHTAAEAGVHFILRYMIDARFQGRGYGRAGMAAVIAQIKRTAGAHKLAISYDASNPAMARLCQSVGFEPTGRLLDDEIEACIFL